MSGDRTITLAGHDGEVERFVVVGETNPSRRKAAERTLAEPFVTVFQAELLRIARMSDLTWSDLRIWLACLAHATLETREWDSNPALIAAELALDVKFVSREQSRLVERGLLDRPRRGKLALPPEIAWRGTVGERAKAVRARKEAS